MLLPAADTSAPSLANAYEQILASDALPTHCRDELRAWLADPRHRRELREQDRVMHERLRALRKQLGWPSPGADGVWVDEDEVGPIAIRCDQRSPSPQPPAR